MGPDGRSGFGSRACTRCLVSARVTTARATAAEYNAPSSSDMPRCGPAPTHRGARSRAEAPQTVPRRRRGTTCDNGTRMSDRRALRGSQVRPRPPSSGRSTPQKLRPRPSPYRVAQHKPVARGPGIPFIGRAVLALAVVALGAVVLYSATGQIGKIVAGVGGAVSSFLTNAGANPSPARRRGRRRGADDRRARPGVHERADGRHHRHRPDLGHRLAPTTRSRSTRPSRASKPTLIEQNVRDPPDGDVHDPRRQAAQGHERVHRDDRRAGRRELRRRARSRTSWTRPSRS